jgi:uncharacterized membrane protein YdjX (TVP38/TMEM64 family)
MAAKVARAEGASAAGIGLIALGDECALEDLEESCGHSPGKRTAFRYAPRPMPRTDSDSGETTPASEPSSAEQASGSDQATPVRLEGRAKYVATPLLVLWCTAPGILGFVALGFIASLNDWIRGFGPQALLVYVLLFACCSGLGILPTYAMSLIGGWIFGMQQGIAGALVGFVGGAMIGYLVSTLAAGDGYRRWLDGKPKAKAIREAFIEQGFWRSLLVVTLLRFPPNSPFALMNLAMTAAGARFFPFAIGTAIGMAPRTIVAVTLAAGAAAAGEKNFTSLFAKRPVETIIGVVVFLVVLGILSQIGKRALAKAGLLASAQA